MSDIVERLRAAPSSALTNWPELTELAADAITTLRDENEALREAAIGLCAAIDNLWNHPDLRRVRAEIPESIALNISRHQVQVRAALKDRVKP